MSFPLKIRQLVALSSFAICGCTHTATSAHSDLYSAYDYVGDGVFTQGVEGPATGPDGFLYAVNFSREGTIGRISVNPDGIGTAALFVELPKGSVGNGIRFYGDRTMYVADYAAHNILKIDMLTRAITVFAHSDAMNQPNDIAITANGVIYASDPKWADNSGQIWRIDRDGTTHLLESNMGTTNGIEVSTDEKHLYVNESVQRKVWVYDLLPNGELANKRLLIEFADFGMDGMRCDSQGNLYIARYGAGVVAVVSPQGKILREISLTGQKPTNVAFGGKDGKTVFVTLQARGAIEAFRAEWPGRSFLLSR